MSAKRFTPSFVAALTLLGLMACQGESITNLNEPIAPEEDPEERLIRERERVEAEARASIGKACSVDLDCPLFLRCQTSACAVPPAVDGDAVPDAPVISFSGGAQFFMELALDDDQRARGLMFRPRMSDTWSMLFVYPNDRPLSFWMKNTLIPLDMVFIKDNGEVLGVVEHAEPLTLSSRKVPGSSRYVLEINAGLAQRFNIKAGDKIQLVRLPDAHMPRGQ